MSQIIRHLTAVSRCGAEYRKQYLENIGIQGNHARFLLEVCELPGISQDRLSRRLLVDKSSVARQSTNLEEAGYIERKTCPDDKRITRLYPTEKTLTLLPQISSAWSTWEALITQSLSEEEVETLALLLRKMKISAREWMEAH